MRGTIIIKDVDIKKFWNVKGYIDMRLRFFDQVKGQLITEDHTNVILHVRTNDKIFESLKKELHEIFPGTCVFLQEKVGAAK